MNRIFRHSVLYILTLAFCTCFTGCQKYSDEEYEGHWQLIEISQPDGTMPEDVRSHGVYWRLQLGILQVMCTGLPAEENPGEVIARVVVEGGFFRLTEIYHSEREADNLITDPADAATLSSLGITAPTEEFRIDELNSSRMVLTSATRRLTFRKF